MLYAFTPNVQHGPQWKWVSLEGPDAQDFLQRVTTVNARDLRVGDGAPGCFLTAQGRIRAFFTLWNYAPGAYAFELESGRDGQWQNRLLEAIDQYTFTEKMTLTRVEGLECRWLLGESAASRLGAPIEPGHTVALEEEIRACHHGSTDYGRPWITLWGRPARLNPWMDRNFSDARKTDPGALDAWRIEALRPRVDHEITETAMPLEIGLMDAIAPNKGCYPGQEVIEKIISLGSPPRRLARIEGQGSAPSQGMAVLNLASPPAEVGQVTSVAQGEGRFIALAWVRKIHAKEGLEVRFEGGSGTGKITRIAP